MEWLGFFFFSERSVAFFVHYRELHKIHIARDKNRVGPMISEQDGRLRVATDHHGSPQSCDLTDAPTAMMMMMRSFLSVLAVLKPRQLRRHGITSTVSDHTGFESRTPLPFCIELKPPTACEPPPPAQGTRGRNAGGEVLRPRKSDSDTGVFVGSNCGSTP